MEALQRADEAWARLRSGEASSGAAPQFVTELDTALGAPPQYDVCVAGGTLGIFVAAALQTKGLRVCVVERGELKGRSQEWNISRKEIAELVHLGVLTASDAEAAVVSEFDTFCGFAEPGAADVAAPGVLNIGVLPDVLIQSALRTFQSAGGHVLQRTQLSAVEVFRDAARLQLGGGGSVSSVTCRLVVDSMGLASPAVRQARWGQPPDGVCLVVGSAAVGFAPSRRGDVIRTTEGISPSLGTQLFWEAFPAAGGPSLRTTYCFAYLDAAPQRPSLRQLLEEYLRLLPAYQGTPLEQLSFQRGECSVQRAKRTLRTANCKLTPVFPPVLVLFGCFPTYRNSPLAPAFDRVLAVGDARGFQSPLSFGGFGAICRHLGRVSDGVLEALACELTDKRSLGLINPYQPNLSAAWLFQRAMSVPVGKRPDPGFVNALLSANFRSMEALGPEVMKPFLQDVVQFRPLALTLLATMARRPLLLPAILGHLGPGPLADWVVHFAALGLYTLAHAFLSPVLSSPALQSRLPPRMRYALRRQLDAWRFGCGADYRVEE